MHVSKRSQSAFVWTPTRSHQISLADDCEDEDSSAHNKHRNNQPAPPLCSVPEPPQIIRHLEPKVASAGRAVRFSLQVSGLPKPQVCWYRDSQPLVTSDTCKFFHDDEEHTLMLLNVLAEDAGTYSCEAKNEYGEAASSAPLTVEGTSAGEGVSPVRGLWS